MLSQYTASSLLAITIHKLLNHSNDASCNSAFYQTGWYYEYEYRETFRHELTVEL